MLHYYNLPAICMLKCDQKSQMSKKCFSVFARWLFIAMRCLHQYFSTKSHKLLYIYKWFHFLHA